MVVIGISRRYERWPGCERGKWGENRRKCDTLLPCRPLQCTWRGPGESRSA